MPPIKRKYQTDSDLQDLILEAIQRLAMGELVGIPTPQGYMAIGKGVETSTISICQPVVDKHSSAEAIKFVTWAWALRDTVELHDLFSPVSATAERLLERFPAGSLVVLHPSESVRFKPNGPLRCYLQQFLTQLPGVHSEQGTGCLKLAGRVGTMLQALAPWPLMVGFLQDSAEASRKYPAGSPESLEKLFPNWLNYTISEGELTEVLPPAIVKIQRRGVQIIQPGQLSDELIVERSGPSLLFVCTGNTCRSPMAEAICRKMLADRLNCQPTELRTRGIEISSAGIAADYGDPASPEVVELLAETGIELGDHQSQPLSLHLLDRADLILTMTAHHRLVILNHRPDLAHRIQVLGLNQKDIPDPFGASMDIYRQCRQTIEAALIPVVDQLVSEL